MARHVPAALFFGALTVLLTWPLLAAFTTHVPHDAGDPMLSTWTLWWNARVVPFSSAWWNGPFFYPETDTLTLSDHRVGLSLIATPLIHLGTSPLVAQNVLFVLSYPLSAMAAYALCYDLTRSRRAAVVGGLIFGFNPFRASHLPHLELLATWWLPFIFLSLHRWVQTGNRRWLVALSALLTLQALTSGYYFVFAGVLVGMWLIWFMPLAGRGESPHNVLARCAELGIALVTPLIAIAPVLWRYREAHAAMELGRSITDIEDLSADLIGLLTPPHQLFLWDAPAAWYNPEGDIFPGATAVLLVAAALWAGRRTAASPAWHPQLRTALLVLASVAAMAALAPLVFGPIAFTLGDLRVSITDPYKPLTVAAVLMAVWAMTTARLREAWRQRSPLAFYSLATVALWLFALGPTARVLGERVLYKAPYWWLMQLPGVGSGLRVPARFAMLAALTLAVAAALSLQRLAPARPAWRPLTGRGGSLPGLMAFSMVCIAIIAESWIYPFPIARAPSPLEVPTVVPSEAVIMELPSGVFEDAAAMYRATLHERPIVNGMSGYTPPIHQKLSAELEKGNLRPIAGLAVDRPIAIFVARGTGDELAAALLEQTSAQLIATTATHQVMLIAARKH